MAILDALLNVIPEFQRQTGEEFREIVLGTRAFDKLKEELATRSQVVVSEGANPNVIVLVGVVIRRYIEFIDIDYRNPPAVSGQ
jgi:hypothetical protein